jgi:RING finger protein 113A
MDYHPERCKDYYERGYCGRGDTCIFIHDRGDYKSGHQLDQEFEAAQRKNRKKAIDGGEESDESNYEIGGDSDDEKIAAKMCVICDSDFKSPVKTQCGH